MAFRQSGSQSDCLTESFHILILPCMDFLRRVGQIAALAGQRLAFSAPAIQQQLISVNLPTQRRKAHYVLSMPLARAVLKDDVRFPQERFLTDLLASCVPEQVRWIQFFVDHSPEFTDGAAQLASRRQLIRELAGYEREAKSVTATSIAEVFAGMTEKANGNEGISSFQLARAITCLYLNTMLSRRFGAAVAPSEDLVFADDIFTPSLRAKQSLVRLNQLLDDFLTASVPSSILEDEARLTTLLSLFLMATTPLAAGLTCLFNQLLDSTGGDAEPTEAMFLEYGMAPTIFVARQAAVDVQLEETQIQAGDSVYVFLSEFRGCPFRPGSTLPFGYGRHICPGRGLASQIMASTQAFVRQHSDVLKQTLRPSSLHPGLPTAFLMFR
jgi:hypothetical protein